MLLLEDLMYWNLLGRFSPKEPKDRNNKFMTFKKRLKKL
jgi:hypothetical protein